MRTAKNDLLTTPPATMDEYLARVPGDQRRALEDLRDTLRKAVPNAVEGISYGVPVPKLNGHPLVGFGAARAHCAFYLMSTGVMEAFAQAIGDHASGKGSLSFQPGPPPPKALVRQLVKARIAELTAPKATATRKKTMKT